GAWPAPAPVTYVRRAPERGEAPLELLPHRGTALHEPVLLQVEYGREARGARHRMVRVRLRVHEAPGAVRDHVDDPLGRRDAGQRHVPPGDPLPHHQDVRHGPYCSIAHHVPVRPAPTRISSATNSTWWRSQISRIRLK